MVQRSGNLEGSGAAAGTKTGPVQPVPGDPLVEAFKRAIDRSALLENLLLSPAQRVEKFLRNMRLVYGLRRAGRRLHRRKILPDE